MSLSRVARQQDDRVSPPSEHERRSAGRPWSGSPRAVGDAPELEHALELVTLIESASDAVVGVSPGGMLTSWSDGAERLFGYRRSEIVGQSVLLLSPGSAAAEAKELLQGVQAGERVERVETERVSKDGRVLKLLLSVSPVWGRDGRFEGAVGIYSDLSAQRRAEQDLQLSERRYHALIEALSEGVVMKDTEGRVIASNQSAQRILGLSAEELTTTSTTRPMLPLIHEDGTPFRAHEHPTLVSIRTRKPQHGVIMGVESREGPIRWLSINSAPLVTSEEDEPYAAVASFSDITELRQTLAELHAARLEDLKRLALVGEYRDDDTNRHTERVARSAELLAAELGLDSEFLTTIRRAAPLHDVGKIGIPDQILLKPGRLTAEEFEIIKTHTVIGGRILCESQFPVLRMASVIAFTHHERWDGAGYPARLQGEQTHIAGRIVAVADAFDAMTHVRPYKRAFSVEHAVAEIERCSGTQFDPKIVQAFMTLDHHALVDSA
jgi:putative two-component system response regulator